MRSGYNHRYQVRSRHMSHKPEAQLFDVCGFRVEHVVQAAKGILE